MCGILRGHESTASINTCNPISVEYKFWRWSLALQPFNGLRCGNQTRGLAFQTAESGRGQRNVLTNTNRIDHAGRADKFCGQMHQHAAAFPSVTRSHLVCAPCHRSRPRNARSASFVTRAVSCKLLMAIQESGVPHSGARGARQFSPPGTGCFNRAASAGIK